MHLHGSIYMLWSVIEASFCNSLLLFQEVKFTSVRIGESMKKSGPGKLDWSEKRESR